MKIFTYSLLAAALVAAPVASAAQTPATPGPRAEAAQRGPAHFPMIERFQAELNLSADQAARLEAIRQRLQTQNEPLIAQLRAAGIERGPGAHMRAGRAGAERTREMTPEQREQMRQRMEERRAAMTPEQREQMRQRMQQQRKNLTPEQREQMRQRMEARRGEAGRQLPEELRPVAQQIRENTRAAMQEAHAVLTPEQRTRLQELVREHRGARQGSPGARAQRPRR